MSFGHCGIDWFHSLLNSVSTILILPELSFFRYWKILECDNAKNSDEMLSIWLDHFKADSRNTPDTKLFQSKNEEEKFSKYLNKELKNKGINKKTVFYSIHNAYALTKGIDFDSIDIIISHEHVSFTFYNIMEEIENPYFLFIVRDPRASIAGYFRGITKKVGHLPDYHDYFINMSIEEWLNSIDIYFRYNHLIDHSIKIIKNENMISNLELEMKKFTNWLGIKFSDKLLIRNHSDGSIPSIDSSYLTKSTKPDKEYFSSKSIMSRWKRELSDNRELIMIETLFNNIMQQFNYSRLTKNSFLNKIKGIYFFLLPHRGPKRLNYYKVNEDEITRYLIRLKLLKRDYFYAIVDFLPKNIQSKIILFHSVLIHIKIYFLPLNRWSRYDNPQIDKTYRNYA
tara:strand:+ start:26138 stop:27328 length:1191 start_codon:yes stop_codon:yes gene_type:complete